MFDFSSIGNLFGSGEGMSSLGGLTNLFGGSSTGQGGASPLPGMQGGSISLPGMQGGNSSEPSFEAAAPNFLGKLTGVTGDQSAKEAATVSPNGSTSGAPADTEKEQVANALAADRAEDAKMDQYTSKIPYAGTYITLGRQNDRKLGALLSAYYMMTNPSDNADPNAGMVDVFPRARSTGSSFLGGL